jgi:hypothetical protein
VGTFSKEKACCEHLIPTVKHQTMQHIYRPTTMQLEFYPGASSQDFHGKAYNQAIFCVIQTVMQCNAFDWEVMQATDVDGTNGLSIIRAEPKVSHVINNHNQSTTLYRFVA